MTTLHSEQGHGEPVGELPSSGGCLEMTRAAWMPQNSPALERAYIEVQAQLGAFMAANTDIGTTLRTMAAQATKTAMALSFLAMEMSAILDAVGHGGSGS